ALVGAHHAVDLRMPGVGCNQDAHGSGRLPEARRRPARPRFLAHGLAPRDQLEIAGIVLDDGRAAFDPVAAVEVADAVDHLALGVVDVAADDAVEAAAAGLGEERALE